jgi:cytochrome c oxidase subunit III
MSVSVAFVALFVGIVVWVLLARRLTAKPWEMPGSTEEVATRGAFGPPPAKIGLWMFLAVVTSLFGLFLSAYWMRMTHAHGDWHPTPALPDLLWLNTGLLILSSAGMQWARSSLRRARKDHVKGGLIVGGLLTLAFLIGQLMAWRAMSASGYFLQSDPAVSFFYVLTAVHGLHLLGGLFVWARTALRMMRPGVELIDVRLSVELCTVYWHYLLLVWLILFAVLLST